MANIFQLFGQIFIDNAEANKNIDTTTEKAEKSGSKVGAAFGSIAKGAAAVGTAVVGAASTIGAAAYKMATNTAGQADVIDKMSERTSINREELQRWMHACDQSGVSSDKLETAVKKMSDVLDDAANGGKTATTALERLGFTVNDFDGLSTEEKFNKITNALADMEDGTERNAIGADILGKAYTEMLPLLNAGSEGIDALKKEADDLGIVMSESDVKAGVKLGDTIANVKAAFNGIKNTLGAAVIPIVQKFADMIIAAIPKVQGLIQDLTPVITGVLEEVIPQLFNFVDTIFPMLVSFIQQLLPVLTEVITAILPVLIGLIETLLPPIMQIVENLLPVIVNIIEALMPLVIEIISAVLPVLAELINQILPPIMQIVDMILPIILSLIETLMPLIVQIIDAVLPVLVELLGLLAPILQPILDLLAMILEPITDLLNLILPPIVKILGELMEKIMPKLQERFQNVATAVSGVFSTAFETVGRIFENAKDIFSNIIDFVKNVFTGNWKGAWENVKNIFADIWDNLKTIVKAPINFIIDGINLLIRGLNMVSFDVPDWVPVIGGKTFGFNINELSKLRVGMQYVPYDDYPALLHRGEQVLTASEAKEKREKEKEEKSGKAEAAPVTVEVNVTIERFENNSEKDVESLADELMSILQDRIKQKGLVFA